MFHAHALLTPITRITDKITDLSRLCFMFFIVAIGYWQLVIGSGVESNVESRKLKVKEDKKAAAVAAANIAIAYELLGDYSLACDYANEACRLFGALKTAWARQQQANIRYYLEQLRAKQAKEGAR